MASALVELPAWMRGIRDPSLSVFLYIAPLAVLAVFLRFIQAPKVPILNPKGPFEFTDTRPKKDYVAGARGMLRGWFTAHPDKAVRMITDFGPITILPPHLTNEIRNKEQLSFAKWTNRAFHADLPGFEGFREGFRDSQLVQAVIMRDLTKHLSKVTEPLANETAMTLPGLFGDSPDWHTVHLRECILRLVARISSRVFHGEELCRNEEWLKITREYTIVGFKAAEELRLWPASLRHVVHWFLPSCQKARALVKDSRRLLEPLLEKRRQQKLAGPVDIDDAVEWVEKEANGRYYDPVTVQLMLSLAAIHTTTDLICQTMIMLLQHPDLVQELRKEIVAVLTEQGWKKTSMYSMKLLDSVIKESQRIKPISATSMRRIALADVELSDGTKIRKDQTVAVSCHRMWDAEVYENPEQWDAYRFYKMRDIPGKENLAQLVSTSGDHLGFGHGQHACPGRFFAANEVKIAVIHLLLMYDWRLPEGAVPKTRTYGFSLTADPTLMVEVRRRQEEIEI